MGVTITTNGYTFMLHDGERIIGLGLVHDLADMALVVEAISEPSNMRQALQNVRDVADGELSKLGGGTR